MKNNDLIIDEEKMRLKKLQMLYDNGEINEEDLSKEDVEKLIALYKHETELLKQDTLKIKLHIEQILSEMKN